MRAIETLEARFLAHARIHPDTVRGLIAWVLFDEAKGHYGGDVRLVRGFDRRELLMAVEQEARKRGAKGPSGLGSLNTIVGRLGEALAAFVATAPRLLLIAAVTGPTSTSRHDELRRTFFHIEFTDTPPVIPSRPARRVPAAPAMLVGRDRESADLRALLAGRPPPPFVVVHGIPGIGRTALARTVVHELLDDGAFTSAVSYAFEGAPPSVAEVLTALVGPSCGPLTDAALKSRYVALLEAPTIVLLDDFPDGWPIEQLQPPRGSVVLLTSQHAVRLPEVENRSLAPLVEEDAIGFLMALDPRLELENPEYEARWRRWTLLGRRGPRPHPTAASELAELCAYVPGEMRAAATALRELPPGTDVRVFLGWYRDSLAGARELGSSATPARTAAYATPYARLPEDERRVFLALSAFGGSFSLDDARVVADDPEGAALAQLARVGFVSYDATAARYIVTTPLRLFGRRLLAKAADRTSVLRRLAAHFAETGARLMQQGSFWLDRTPADVLVTFVAAQRAAEEVDDAVLLACFGELAARARAPREIAYPWLESAAAAVRTLDAPELLLRIAIGRIDLYRGSDPDRARAVAEEALTAVQVDDARGASGEAIGRLREVVAQLGMRMAKALGRARSVLAFGAERLKRLEVDNDANHDTFAVLIAEAHADLGRLEEARRWARHALREAHDRPHRVYRANALNVLGSVLLASGRHADAMRAFDAALALYPDAFDATAEEAYRAPSVAELGPPTLDLALRDAYADPAKLHPALVAYTQRIRFVEDLEEAARRCGVVAAAIVAVRQHMPAFYVTFGTVLLELARRIPGHAHPAHAFYWLTCAIGLFTPRGMDDLLLSDGMDIVVDPLRSTEAMDSASLLIALTRTPFSYLQNVRAVGNAYYHRAETLLLLENPRAAVDDFEAAGALLSTIESPLLPRIAEWLRGLRRVRR